MCDDVKITIRCSSTMKSIAIPISLVLLSVEMHCCRRTLCDADPSPDKGDAGNVLQLVTGHHGFPVQYVFQNNSSYIDLFVKNSRAENCMYRFVSTGSILT